MKINVVTSARHIHLNEEDFKLLFGDITLTKNRDLNQIGQFASNEKVNIITEKGRFDGVRIVGPLRSYTQFELSKTDAYKLGINPPVRKSGDLEGASLVTIEHDGKSIDRNCAIIPDRHIHVNTNDVEHNLKNDQVVKLKLFGEKGGILDNVNVKVSDDGYFEAHIDTDDANAHLVDKEVEGEIYE